MPEGVWEGAWWWGGEWGGGPPMAGDPGSHWWLPASVGATGWIWPRRVRPGLARCGCDSVGLAIRLAGV